MRIGWTPGVLGNCGDANTTRRKPFVVFIVICLFLFLFTDLKKQRNGLLQKTVPWKNCQFVCCKDSSCALIAETVEANVKLWVYLLEKRAFPIRAAAGIHVLWHICHLQQTCNRIRAHTFIRAHFCAHEYPKPLQKKIGVNYHKRSRYHWTWVMYSNDQE